MAAVLLLIPYVLAMVAVVEAAGFQPAPGMGPVAGPDYRTAGSGAAPFTSADTGRRERTHTIVP